LTAGTEAPALAKKLPRWRRALVAILVILSVVLVPIAGVTIWVRNLVLNTNRYVDTVAPLATNTAITNAVADKLTTRLFQQVDVQAQAKDALPDRAQFLAGPLSTGVETFTREAAKRVLASDQFATVWRTANERVHSALNKALTGEGKNVSIKNGKVVLNLTPVVEMVIKQLDDRGVTVFDSVLQDVTKKNLQFELFDAKQLEKARSAVHLLDRVRILLVVLVFVLLGLALLLSGNRRRTLIRWGIGLVIAMGIVAGLLALGRSIYLDAVSGTNLPRDAAAAGWDTLLRYLKNGVRVIALGGIIVAIAAFLSGPSRAAVRVRKGARDLVNWTGREADEAGWSAGPVGAWVAKHKVLLRFLGVALVIVALFFLSRPTPISILVLVLLLLLYLAVIEFLGRAPTKPRQETGTGGGGGTAP
jgi:hypothetical protein